MRILSLVFALLFFAFAALQWNDPDPLLWILIYGYVAVVALLDFLNKTINPLIILISVIAGFLYSFFYLPGLIDLLDRGGFNQLAAEMHASTMYIEESREFLGLLIALGVLLFYYFRYKRKYHATK
ncbi:transmembrane 220 family protein [Fulvivirga ligni]|uniref:transmembrane 220 family protein n=1 Tax=Fulvivirga ligni TaxID=2904246 RepID=UPI001F284106|nr:transmembrane 220 family protein [Fulvivirga ligni]UII18942.1 transmembrane 220 family protein [Fulvivirga ligni]